MEGKALDGFLAAMRRAVVLMIQKTRLADW